MQQIIDNNILYSKEYKIEIGKPGDRFFFFFDYDDRYYSINMEFQHFHSFYEMCIFLDDEASHLINGVLYDMRCGDIVCLRPGLLHKTVYPQGDPKKRLIIQFSLPPMFYQLDRCMKSIYSIFDEDVPIFRFEDRYKKAIFEKLNDIFHISGMVDDLTTLKINNRFLEFLGLIYTYREKNIYSNEADFDPITGKIYKITEYIHNHYTEELSLDMLASEFYISNYYLSHQFKRVTGFNITQYIQMTRVRNAQSMLVSTDEPITEIAFACGFFSFSQFNRVFHKFIGSSPSAYRKEVELVQKTSLLHTEDAD